MPALISTAPRKKLVSEVKQRNRQIEVLKLEIFFYFAGAWIANEAKRTPSFHSVAGLSLTASGVSIYRVLYPMFLALEINQDA